MNTVLVVDDELIRRDEFNRRLTGSILDFADNPLDAIKLIRSKVYDFIFLDHDLGDAVLDGRDVCTCFYMSKNIHASVIVHSINPAGGDAMVHILSNLGVPVGRIPFSHPKFWALVSEEMGRL